MTSSASKVHETTTCEYNDSVTIWENESINLILDRHDLHSWIVLKAVHVDLVIEVTNVANNGVVFHLGHVSSHDDLEVSSCSDENITCGGN